MERLEKARKTINLADENIAKHFEDRMHAAEAVIACKMDHKLPIFDPVREKEVISRNLALIKDERLKPYYEDMLVQLMRISKEYQQEIMAQKESCDCNANTADCKREEI